MKIIFFFTSIILFSFIAYSQGELNEENKIFFRNEKSYGISLNSNGWGFGYRYGKRIKAKRKWLFEGDFNIMKHKKEFKQTNPTSTSFSRFVYGKYNFVFNTQFSIGQQNELFRKQDLNSVSIRLFWLAGVTTAFVKPIYYRILEDDNIIERKFTQSTSSFYILGKLPYYKGIDEIGVVPGGLLKAGISFEFSKKDNRLSILEAGLIIELYPKKIEIMAIEDNQMFFPLVFVTYRFGKVVSGYHLKEIDEK